MPEKVRYEVLFAGKWTKVNKATTGGMKEGWLHWQHGQEIGLAKPGSWRRRVGHGFQLAENSTPEMMLCSNCSYPERDHPEPKAPKRRTA